MNKIILIVLLGTSLCWGQVPRFPFYKPTQVTNEAPTSLPVAVDDTNTVIASASYVDVPLTIGAYSNPFVLVQGWTYNKDVDSVKNTTDNVKLIKACYVTYEDFDSGIWYQAAPSAGAKNFRVYGSVSGTIGGSAVSFYNVNQVTPLRGVTQTAFGTSAYPGYTSFATNDSDEVFSCILYNINAGNYWAIGDGDSLYAYLEGEGTSGDLAVEGRSITPTGATQTFNFELQASVIWDLNICSIRRAVEDRVEFGLSTVTTSNDTVFSHVSNTTDGLLTVLISVAYQTINFVTYNGDTLTQITYRGNSGFDCYAYQLANPDNGTHNIVVSPSSPTTDFKVIAMSWDKAEVRGYESTDNTSTTPSRTMTSAGGDFVIDIMTAYNGTNSLTVGADQVVTSKSQTPGSEIWSGSSIEPGAASTTMSWTLGSSQAWSIITVAIKPK